MDEYTEGDRECNIMNKLPTLRVQLRLSDDWQKKKKGEKRGAVAKEEKWKEIHKTS